MVGDLVYVVLYECRKTMICTNYEAFDSNEKAEDYILNHLKMKRVTDPDFEEESIYTVDGNPPYDDYADSATIECLEVK